MTCHRAPRYRSDDVYTIGYEGTTIDAFLDALQDAGVTLLVDVRDFPSSRKPGFSKSPLRARLGEAGIGYEHWKDLGTPKEVRDAYRATGDFQPFEEAYHRILADRTDVVERLAVRVRSEAACLLCYERDPAECHRSILTTWMSARGTVRDVEHLVVE